MKRKRKKREGIFDQMWSFMYFFCVLQIGMENENKTDICLYLILKMEEKKVVKKKIFHSLSPKFSKSGACTAPKHYEIVVRLSKST